MPLSSGDRTIQISLSVDAAFNRVARRTESVWSVYNGSEDYFLANIPDYLIVQEMILKGLENGQKEFVFMDVGAGDFTWGRNVERIIDENPIFDGENFSVLIYSVRGEQNNQAENIRGKRCTRYEFGNFKIEDFNDALEVRGHNLRNRVDLMVSNACLRHLVDPVGTLLQMCENSRPKTGLILFDSLFLEINGLNYDSVILMHPEKTKVFGAIDSSLFNLGDDIEYGFMCYEESNIFGFFMQKMNDNLLSLPLNYDRLISLRGGGSSETCIVFNKSDGWQDLQRIESEHKRYGNFCYFGSPRRASEPMKFVDEMILNFPATKRKFESFLTMESSWDRDDIEDVASSLNKTINSLSGQEFLKPCLVELVSGLLSVNNGIIADILNYSEGENPPILIKIVNNFLRKKDRQFNHLTSNLINVASVDSLNYRDSFDHKSIRDSASYYEREELVKSIDSRIAEIEKERDNSQKTSDELKNPTAQQLIGERVIERI